MNRRDLCKAMLGLPAVLLVPELEARSNHPIDQIRMRTAAMERDLGEIVYRISPMNAPLGSVASQRGDFEWHKDELVAVSDHTVMIDSIYVAKL